MDRDYWLSVSGLSFGPENPPHPPFVGIFTKAHEHVYCHWSRPSPLFICYYSLEDWRGEEYLILLHMLLNVLIDPPPANHQNCSQQLQITKFRSGLYLFLICFTKIKEKNAMLN
jgi:hypothetical protein